MGPSMNPDLIYLFTGEIIIILLLYKFVFRQMIVTHWEEKIAEDECLIINFHSTDKVKKS